MVQLEIVIDSYTRESGVRNLERKLINLLENLLAEMVKGE